MGFINNIRCFLMNVQSKKLLRFNLSFNTKIFYLWGDLVNLTLYMGDLFFRLSDNKGFDLAWWLVKYSGV